MIDPFGYVSFLKPQNSLAAQRWMGCRTITRRLCGCCSRERDNGSVNEDGDEDDDADDEDGGSTTEKECKQPGFWLQVGSSKPFGRVGWKLDAEKEAWATRSLRDTM